MNQGYVIRYPPAVHELFRKINRLREEYQKAGRPEPSPRIMAERLETTLESVNAALTMFQVVSINQPVGDGEETLENVIPGDEGISIQEGEELREAIETLLLSLKPNERRILKLRYGLAGGIVSALNEVGADLKITRDHARQIEAKALAKLRKSLKVQAQKTRFC
jgi:RNA polymerase primary sigma factor